MAALRALSVAALICCCAGLSVRDQQPKFSVIAFFTAKKDPARISFVHEAELWFPEMAAKYNCRFDTTSNWQNLNADFLSRYQVVVFWDTRPADPTLRTAVQACVWHGGGGMGVHCACFVLTP